MLTAERVCHSPSLERTRRRLERWRSVRTHPMPMPEALWTDVLALARRDGVTQTAAALRVNPSRLRQRLEAAGRAAAPAFVELVSAPPTGRVACVIAIDGARGRRLRIELPDAALSDLVTFARLAWDEGR